MPMAKILVIPDLRQILNHLATAGGKGLLFTIPRPKRIRQGHAPYAVRAGEELGLFF